MTDASETDLVDWPVVPIDWPEFWQSESTDPEYVIEPLFAKGRQTAIFSTAKEGKSLLVLDAVAAGVTGRSVFGQPAKDPVRVVYIDLEMTEADLRERLVDLGYGPADNLSGLAYYQLPDLPPLDRDLGGVVLAEIAAKHQADLVVIDTMARVVAGPENDADTYRAFYQHTGLRLKAMGVALARLDHMGKTGEAGQRGSSAKADDVDTVYRLSGSGDGHLRLDRTHTRVPWMPAEIRIARRLEPHLHHVLSSDSWPAGTADAAQALDDLDVPLDATATTAQAALRSAQRGKSKTVVLAALKFRRSHS
jgi:hypothetical protein